MRHTAAWATALMEEFPHVGGLIINAIVLAGAAIWGQVELRRVTREGAAGHVDKRSGQYVGSRRDLDNAAGPGLLYLTRQSLRAVALQSRKMSDAELSAAAAGTPLLVATATFVVQVIERL